MVHVVTPTATPTDTATDTPTDTATATATDTPTNTPTNTFTDTPTPTYTSTDTPTDTPTNTHTATGTPTNTPTDTFTPTPTPTDTATDTPTPTDTDTPTSTFTSTPTPTNTFTATSTPTNTFTPTITNTPTITLTPTITDTPTITSTPTITNTPGAATIVGHVLWQGRPPQPNALQQLPITLTIKMGSTEVNYPVQTTDSSGFFTDTADLPAGLYNWRVKNPKYLANAGTFTLVRGATIQVYMDEMRAGDCNDDNVVNISDFVILKNTFGKQVGDLSYDDRANFDGNLVVNAVDFNIFRMNYGMGGAPPITPFGNEGK